MQRAATKRRMLNLPEVIFPNPAVRHSFRDKQSDFVLEKPAGVNRQASPFTSEIIRAGAFASDAGSIKQDFTRRSAWRSAFNLAVIHVVSKVADSRYISGRGNDWVKKTCAQRETLTIASFALDGTD
jgi:hypothetical protein